jgi:hypothetical protein
MSCRTCQSVDPSSWKVEVGAKKVEADCYLRHFYSTIYTKRLFARNRQLSIRILMNNQAMLVHFSSSRSMHEYCTNGMLLLFVLM